MKTGAVKMRAKFCCFLLVSLALAACKPNGNGGNSTASAQGKVTNDELCQKYASCGCDSYEG